MTSSAKSVPAITVIMSCYNAAPWVDIAIISVLNQTFSDYEFIIIDDGSVDNTLEIIQGFSDTDARIIVITKPNTGLSDSLNIGIQQARGEWIARIDADDICERDRFEKQINIASGNSELVFIGSSLTMIDSRDRILKAHYYPTRHAALLQHLRTARKFPPHSSAFMRTNIVRKLNGYRVRMHRAQDVDLWLRLSEVGGLACLNEPLVRIRKHPEQISHDVGGERQIIDSKQAMVSHWLRQLGVVDPVDADEASYEEFRAWLIGRLHEQRLFEFKDYKAHLMVVCGAAMGAHLGVIRLLYACISRPLFLVRLIRERFLGESITHRLAIEWMKQSKNVKT